MGKEENLICGLNDVYGVLCEYTSGEEDEEIIKYHDELLDTIQETIQYVHSIAHIKRLLQDTWGE